MSARTRTIWTFAITSIALFMVTLDNLVVTTALPVIRDRPRRVGIEGLEWTVNAYTLTFAVLLLTGAALGDRFGRRRVFAIGLGIFTLASAAAALAPSIEALERRARGAGARRRDRHAADADDPLGGRPPGAARSRARRVGRHQRPRRRVRPARRRRRRRGHLVAVDLLAERPDRPRARAARAARGCDETLGPTAGSTCPGSALASAGLFGIVWGLVRGNALGWASPRDRRRARRAARCSSPRSSRWELRAPAPMLPMRFFRNRDVRARERWRRC